MARSCGLVPSESGQWGMLGGRFEAQSVIPQFFKQTGLAKQVQVSVCSVRD